MLTVKVVLVSVLVIVQLAGTPSLIGTFVQLEVMTWPGGTVSLAEQVEPLSAKCLTVVENGKPGAALPEVSPQCRC